jgi:hypothetical protein
MPSLDWAKIKVATLMIGASAKSFDWRTASPEAIGCEVGDITGKLTGRTSAPISPSGG